MKYISQIINGNVNIESLVITNKYLKPVSIVFALWVALMGLIIFTGALTVALGLDSERYVRLNYLKHAKMQRRVNYITEVVESLTSDITRQCEAKKLLIEML